MVAGAAAFSSLPKSRAQASLGTLTWVEAGSLWIRELPDGPALKLASAEGLHSPRFSASGRWIAFEDKAAKGWLLRSDGKTGAALDGDAASLLSPEDRALLHPNGVFSPDRQRYVFSRDLTTNDGPSVGQLCLASLASPDREPDVLVFDQNGGKQPYAWTRDGKSVIYWSCNDWGVSPWCDGVGLYLVDIESGRSRELGVSSLYNRDLLDLAPSGNQLAVTVGKYRETWQEQRITIIDLDTNVARPLMPDDVASVSPAWAPDGSRIACSAGPDAEIAYARATTGTAYTVVRPDGTPETKTMTPQTRIGIGGGDEAHAYVHQRKIWLLDPSGTNSPRQLTSDSHYRDEEPSWSADGRHILFARMDYEGHSSLWLMEASGSSPIRICGLQIKGEPVDNDTWFGYYGHIDWHTGFDWRP
jgi:Tol biopolymer transport system component